MSGIYLALFGWMPAFMQIPLLGLIAILIIRIVLNIVKIVLDAIPFI